MSIKSITGKIPDYYLAEAKLALEVCTDGPGEFSENFAKYHNQPIQISLDCDGSYSIIRFEARWNRDFTATSTMAIFWCGGTKCRLPAKYFSTNIREENSKEMVQSVTRAMVNGFRRNTRPPIVIYDEPKEIKLTRKIKEPEPVVPIKRENHIERRERSIEI